MPPYNVLLVITPYLPTLLKGCGSGWKENKCTICKENFPSRSVTMEHIASKHKDFQLSKCSVCDTKFLTEKSLNYHMIESLVKS